MRERSSATRRQWRRAFAVLATLWLPACHGGEFRGTPCDDCHYVTFDQPVPAQPSGGSAAETGRRLSVSDVPNLPATSSAGGSAHAGERSVGPVDWYTNAGLYLAPRVVFVEEAREVSVYGSALPVADGDTVFVDDVAVGTLAVMGGRIGKVSLPPLARGAHRLRIEGSAASARFDAIERHVLSDVDITMRGGALQVVYDPAREALFAVVFDGDLNQYAFVRLRFDGTQWQVDYLEMPTARAIGMTADGSDVLVTTAECELQRIDPDTLVVSPPERLVDDCDEPVLRMVSGLADGRVVYASVAGGAELWEYPTRTSLAAPALHYATTQLAQDGTQLIWAAGTSVDSEGAYRYDVGSREFLPLHPSGDPLYSDETLAISGDGSRFLHLADVYDLNSTRLGSLDEGERRDGPASFSADGQLLVTVAADRTHLRAYDLRGLSGDLVEGTELSKLGDRTRVWKLQVDAAGSSVFVFASQSVDPDGGQTRNMFLVRRLAKL